MLNPGVWYILDILQASIYTYFLNNNFTWSIFGAKIYKNEVVRKIELCTNNSAAGKKNMHIKRFKKLLRVYAYLPT